MTHCRNVAREPSPDLRAGNRVSPGKLCSRLAESSPAPGRLDCNACGRQHAADLSLFRPQGRPPSRPWNLCTKTSANSNGSCRWPSPRHARRWPSPAAFSLAKHREFIALLKNGNVHHARPYSSINAAVIDTLSKACADPTRIVVPTTLLSLCVSIAEPSYFFFSNISVICGRDLWASAAICGLSPASRRSIP
jgi:hypothetical protein